MLIGAGCYDLNSERVAKNGAWRAGVVRLLQAEIPDELAPFFSPLLDTIRRVNAGTTSDEISLYPDSPVIAAKLIRPHVVVIPNEVRRDDRQALERVLRAYRNRKVTWLNGFVALKSMLPPKLRRDVFLTDPPFEQAGELRSLVVGLREGV